MEASIDETARRPARAADAPLMARALAGLYLAGATMVVLTLVLPHQASPNEVGSILVLANAYLVARAALPASPSACPGG